MTAVDVRHPEERTCECCGRRERWAEQSWRVAETGDRFCVHEWDINGSFVPFRRAVGSADADASE